jgi:hypothetical protein
MTRSPLDDPQYGDRVRSQWQTRTVLNREPSVVRYDVLSTGRWRECSLRDWHIWCYANEPVEIVWVAP